MTETCTFPPGSLRQLLVQRTAQAIQHGALHTIETEQLRISQDGIEFLVRSVSSLQRKRRARDVVGKKQQGDGRDFNPFLPPETELTVTPVGRAHIAVLNKYNVLHHHLLIVTRAFQPQERLLDCGDFDALRCCMAEIDGLAFYNGGTVAGASQRHKHLQVVPLPLVEGEVEVPIAPVLPLARDAAAIPAFPFAHRFAWLDGVDWAHPHSGERLLEIYRRLLTAIDVHPVAMANGPRQSAPYNLLLTRRWMLAVPRRQEHCGSISVNSLGFAGSLFVRNREEMDEVRRIGPLGVLRRVVEGG